MHPRGLPHPIGPRPVQAALSTTMSGARSRCCRDHRRAPRWRRARQLPADRARRAEYRPCRHTTASQALHHGRGPAEGEGPGPDRPRLHRDRAEHDVRRRLHRSPAGEREVAPPGDGRRPCFAPPGRPGDRRSHVHRPRHRRSGRRRAEPRQPRRSRHTHRSRRPWWIQLCGQTSRGTVSERSPSPVRR